MNYIRVRQVLGAPGKGHKYVVQPYVIVVATGEVKKHPLQEETISAMPVRMKDGESKWLIQEDGMGCGWRILAAERVLEINNPALTNLINGEQDGDKEEA